MVGVPVSSFSVPLNPTYKNPFLFSSSRYSRFTSGSQVRLFWEQRYSVFLCLKFGAVTNRTIGVNLVYKFRRCFIDIAPLRGAGAWVCGFL